MKSSDPSTMNHTQSVEQTSHSLITRVQQQESQAWDKLVDLYSPLVYFWCRESGLTQPDIHDLFQEVFCNLARNIGKFRRIENGSFRGWLRTLTRNRIIDHFRASGREPRPFGGTEAHQYFEQIPQAGQTQSFLSCDTASQEEIQIHHSILCRALESIRGNFTEKSWKAFWMVVVDGRETGDVADELAMRPGTVRVAKSRVLKRLRQELGDSID